MGVSALFDTWMGGVRRLIVAGLLVNVPVLHEPWRTEKVGLVMLCGCAGAEVAHWFPNVGYSRYQILHCTP